MEAKLCTLKPNILNFQSIHNTLISANLTQSSIFGNKPTLVGAAILELFKTLLYDFHYNELKQRFGGNITAVYKDTD